MLIEIHMIQNHSPSNLNRDDLGAPKTCLFGGVTRARISSQCLKRSIRNPGNSDDIHNRVPGMFANALAAHMGARTKLFPYLVEHQLKTTKTEIPEEEHERIILAAQRIGASKEKKAKTGSENRDTDPRPKTAQLIHLGPEHAQLFVRKLATLRQNQKDCYEYFLNPRAAFEEVVDTELGTRGLDEDSTLRKKIVSACWLIAKCRMSELLKAPDGEEPEEEPGMIGGQPGESHARLIAAKMSELTQTDEKFKELTCKATAEEKKQIKIDAPKKPTGMKGFLAELKKVHRCDAVDIALFGRMTTSDAFGDVEAAMQVAHAVSTHEVVNEVDYFTAVDDLARGVGAGHVGEAMYNAACFYKYFCLDWDQLVGNLAGPEPDQNKHKAAFEKWTTEVKAAAERLAACTLGHFLRAAALTTPSGKQNSFASNCEPAGILVEIKKDTKVPTSYANAFAEPARKIGDPPDDAADCVSLVGRSIAQFGDQVHQLRRTYGSDSVLYWYALPLYRYPLQGWEREDDGRKAKVRDKAGNPTGADKPPVKFASRCFDVLGGEPSKHAGLVEAVVKEVSGLEWSAVCDVGKTPPKGA